LTFTDRLKKGVILFDGAMGTQIHDLNPTNEEWDGKLGCSEVLNLTVPDKIQHIHEKYFAAGSDVVETNTFGANEIVLAEYDLQDRTIEINRIAAEIAHKAANKFKDKPRFVAGSIGPGTKLLTLGQTDFDTMYKSYYAQAKGLIEGKVDLFVIETCQDVLQIKSCLLAVTDAMAEHNVKVPLIVSVTVETTGTLLIGSEIGAVLATLAPYDIDVLGMNCATGPDHMRPYIKQICQQFAGPVICQPNAGLPQNVNGNMAYTLTIQEFVETLSSFVQEEGVQIAGGCCGTTPEFISALNTKLKNIDVKSRQPQPTWSVASLFSTQTLHQNPGPFFVGERANTNGSKKFREYLLANDWDGVIDVAREQQNTGAHGLDLCVAYTGRDEAADMKEAVRRIATQINLPLFIDSTDVAVIEQALKLYGGRAVINSINLEDGEPRAHKICELAKRYGAGLIALTIDEKGMALTVEQKVEVAKRIYNIAVKQHGLHPQDLIFDALTFTLGSGDEAMKDSGKYTIDAIKAIKKELPGAFTILGVSNISFGLNPYSREILNSVFMAEAINVGLDLAIVNVKKIIPLYKLEDKDVNMCLNLIYNKDAKKSLFDFIEHFDKKAGTQQHVQEEDDSLPVNVKIKNKVIQGNRSGLEPLLMDVLKDHKAIEIINTMLIPAMKIVGDLFGEGKMQLPFVLQSAEVMKFAVDKLQPFMEKTDEQSLTSIVLATVRGDVHDIGKNLVDIILSNNGYKVYNLGIKCEIDRILQEAERVNADAIGMSGLLVKSTVVMKENLEEMKSRKVNIPVLLGGAALTRSYVDDVCGPIVDAPVVYCTDAFDGLETMQLIKENRLSEYIQTLKENKPKVSRNIVKKNVEEKEIVRRDINIPKPPFWGDKIIEDINLETVYSFLTETVLFRGRWGYRRGKMTKEDYEKLLHTRVRPEFELLKKQCAEKALLVPKVIYGYYPCNSSGEEVIVYKPNTNEEWLRFAFPRQTAAPHKCVADYFLPTEFGQRDVIVLQVVTVGEKADKEALRLYKSNAYKDYLLFHGLSVEAAEALAEYVHLRIRKELNIAEEDGKTIEDFVVQQYRGSRYSFGYPACPDLAENRKLFELLKPERIGIILTEEDQMVPEQTTSAFIVHHPQAKYFNVD
jgi:5-methyltetrahydrofolate--homocysteine methyltransferase